MPAEGQRAGIGFGQTHDGAQRRRFARSITADQRNRLAGGKMK